LGFYPLIVVLQIVLRLRSALPFIFASMKISITLAIIGVIVSEFIASQAGIGYLIKLSSALLDTPLMIAAITCSVRRARALWHHRRARAAGGPLASRTELSVGGA
jgi:hypothetical protein